MLSAICNADFNEEKTGRLGHSLSNIEEISFEDRKFLKTMEKIKKSWKSLSAATAVEELINDISR